MVNICIPAFPVLVTADIIQHQAISMPTSWSRYVDNLLGKAMQEKTGSLPTLPRHMMTLQDDSIINRILMVLSTRETRRRINIYLVLNTVKKYLLCYNIESTHCKHVL